MKRLLTILLSLLLPVQFAWASISGHCLQGQGGHPIHAASVMQACHDHVSQASPLIQDGEIYDGDAVADLGSSDVVDHDCVACHLGFAAPLGTDLTSVAEHVADSPAFFYDILLSSTYAKRPDRPQWPSVSPLRT